MPYEEIRLLALLDGEREREIEREHITFFPYLCLCLLSSLSSFPHLWVILVAYSKTFIDFLGRITIISSFFIIRSKFLLSPKKMLKYLDSIIKKLKFFSIV